ncbi:MULTISPECIES: hypothetical protein [Clavibacter]|uniref:Uncharacterized protein n=1 Tax=Clavibacter tessellarius TaxID=31965 RepID=A0A154UYA2_9MICO|nr:hypothetical protein [Clavibacter michiganensis]KZC94123.1 hypothetical protein AWH51_14615 [Clavibacter michiganensis subsp. tessellarius]
MTHATKAAAAAALALGLVLTATTAAQAEAAHSPTTTTATARIAAFGGDYLPTRAHRFRGIPPRHGSHLNDDPTHAGLAPICRHCAS